MHELNYPAEGVSRIVYDVVMGQNSRDCWDGEFVVDFAILYAFFPFLFGVFTEGAFELAGISVKELLCVTIVCMTGYLTYTALAGAYLANRQLKEEEDKKIIAKLEEL